MAGRDDERTGEAAAGQPATSTTGIVVKLQLDLPNGGRIGPGKIRLLELIEAQGSLSRAAEAMNVSYRRAWLFIQHINGAFDQPSVATPEHGHGGAAARLTDFGKELIRRYRQMEAVTARAGEDTVSWLADHEKSKANSP